MARRLATILLGAILCLTHLEGAAQAAELDGAGEAEAKQATRLYKQGMYEEAARLYAKLSVDYPDMPIFERNMGACYYYLKRPEPALSNLRNYLLHKKDIVPDDKAVVERWIEEMERLRAQNEMAAKAPPTAEPAAPVPVPVPAAPSFPTLSEAPPVPPAPAPPAPVPASTAPEPVPAAGPPSRPAALDLTTRPAAASDSAAESPPFYTRWWFWGTVGAVVVAGAVTAVVLSKQSGGSNIPATVFGNQEAFQ